MSGSGYERRIDASTPHTVIQEYASHLKAMRYNDGGEINFLAGVARDNVPIASSIVATVEKHIKTCPADSMLWGLYIIDAIVKKVKTPEYEMYFKKNLFEIFTFVYKKSDHEKRAKMERLLHFWHNAPDPVTGNKRAFFDKVLLERIGFELRKLQSSNLPQAGLSAVRDAVGGQYGGRQMGYVHPGSHYGQDPRLMNSNSVQAMGSVATHAYPPQMHSYDGRIPQPGQMYQTSAPGPQPGFMHGQAIHGGLPAYGMGGNAPQPRALQMQAEMHPGTQSHSQPEQPPVLDPNILKNLMNSGLLSSLKAITSKPNAVQKQEPVVEVSSSPSLSKSSKENNDAVDSAAFGFNRAFLRRRSNVMIEAIYSKQPHQCMQTGKRFPSKALLKQHLDGLYQKKRLMKEEDAELHRKWYLPAEQWQKGVNAIAEEDSATKFEEQMPQEPAKMMTVPADPHIDTCALSGEKFEAFYNPVDEQWHFKDAIKLDAPYQNLEAGTIVKASLVDLNEPTPKRTRVE